jgi:hypothetical protein
MGAVAIKILTGWTMMAVVFSLGAAAIIRVGERLHKEEVLTALFAAVSDLQSNR